MAEFPVSRSIRHPAVPASLARRIGGATCARLTRGAERVRRQPARMPARHPVVRCGQLRRSRYLCRHRCQGQALPMHHAWRSRPGRGPAARVRHRRNLRLGIRSASMTGGTRAALGFRAVPRTVALAPRQELAAAPPDRIRHLLVLGTRTEGVRERCSNARPFLQAAGAPGEDHRHQAADEGRDHRAADHHF